jgi:hypothetical protein
VKEIAARSYYPQALFEDRLEVMHMLEDIEGAN